MGNAEQGLRLLLSRDAAEARVVAESLEEDNDLRRRYDEEALIEAAAQVESELCWPECASILLWSERWHPGVIGIVASRLVERFHRPTLLVSMQGELGRGSGRSLPGLDLNQVLGCCHDLLEGYGGHAFAAGLTVKRDRLAELRTRFESLVLERLDPSDRAPQLVIDAEVRLAECDARLVEWLERMSPHGLGNPEPVFAARGLRIASANTVGAGKHLKLVVTDGSATAEVIGFGHGERLAEVSGASTIDLAFAPSRNDWMGETRIQLKLKALQIP